MVDPEPYIDAAIASLQDDATGVNYFLGLANAAHAPGFAVATVADEDIHAGGGTMLLRWPAVEVAAPDWDLTNVSLAQMSGDLSLRMIAMCWYQETDFDTLYRASMRFADATLRCLMQPDAFAPVDDRAVVAAVSGRYRVNPETNERAEFTAGTLLAFTLDIGADR